MDRNPRIYLETTLFNYYVLDEPKRNEDISVTKKLFGEVKDKVFEAFTSALTVEELGRCEDVSRREKMFDLIEKFQVKKISFEESLEYEELAEKYIIGGAIPTKKRGDALHIAIASVAKMDILVSWNRDHIVRYKTQQIVRTINLVEGYGELAINTPKEVIE